MVWELDFQRNFKKLAVQYHNNYIYMLQFIYILIIDSHPYLIVVLETGLLQTRDPVRKQDKNII